MPTLPPAFPPGNAARWRKYEIDDLRGEMRGPTDPSKHGLIPVSAVVPGTRIIICARVSAWEQERDPKGNHLDDQMISLYRVAKHHGAVVVGVYRDVRPGADTLWLAPAVDMARHQKAVLLAESTSRFLRSSDYEPKNEYWDSQPRLDEFLKLLEAIRDTRLVTAIDPDATAQEERHYQSNRGVQMKAERPIRRGAKKWWRTSVQPLVRELRSAGGHGTSAIARMTGVPDSLVSDWLRGDD